MAAAHGGRGPRRPCNAGEGRAPLRAPAGSDRDRPRLPGRGRRDRTCRCGTRRRGRAGGRSRRPRGAGCGVFRALDRPAGPVLGHARRGRKVAGRARARRLRTMRRMALELVSAGESHGPALVAIVTGLPAGLVLDRAPIDADLRRRQQGYGRSPRQKIETDEVEVLAGLRHGRTLGTPLALVVRNRDHANWEWGMSPWPPEGDAAGKGSKRVTLPRPGHADFAGSLKYGLDDARDALERASARHTAVHVAAGTVAKALLATIGIAVRGEPFDIGLEARIDEARADR